MSRIRWRPGEPTGPARFGLSQDAWRRVLAMHAAYEQRGPLDRASFTPSRRLEFAKYLCDTGKINEGTRRDGR